MNQDIQDPDVYLDRDKNIVVSDFTCVEKYDPDVALRAMALRHGLGVSNQRVLIRIGPGYLDAVNDLIHPAPEQMLEFTAAIAFVMETPLDIAKMREFIRRFQGKMPVEVFNNEITAIAWLRHQ